MVSRSIGPARVPWWAGQFGLFAASVIALVMLPALFVFVMQNYGSRLRKREVEVATPAVEAQGDLQTAIANETVVLTEFQLTGNTQYARSAAAYRSDIVASVDSLTSAATRLGPQLSETSDGLKRSVGEWLRSIDELQLTEKRYPADEIPGLLLRQSQLTSNEAEAENRLQQAIHTEMYEKRNQVRHLGRFTLHIIFGLSLFGAVLIILIARLVRRLQQETAARAQILCVVSHDLRNPLTTIQLSSAALLQTRENLSQERKKFLQMIRSSSDRMNTLIADLIDQNRTAMGLPLVTNKTEQDVCELINEVCERAATAGERKGLRVHCRIDASCTVMIDRDRILQVISNLVDNAFRHASAGGYVDIGSQVRTESVEIYVRNSGEHVAVAQMDRLFQEYWQGGTRPGGFGLGLTIARAIVEQHGGRIWVENRDDGPAFCFTLPRKLKSAAA